MTTEKMTIHKALAELKTLDTRISKAIQSNPFVFANKHSNEKVNGVTVQAFSEEVKDSYKSVNDLMNRRSALKKAVVLSNASTKVTIGGKEYTIAEAIEFKNNAIPLMQKLLKKMTEDNFDARVTAERSNGLNLENRADEHVKVMFEKADIKNLSDEMKKARENFIAAQTMEIVDPIGIVGEMKKLEDKINAFTVDVDSALSVSNALTEIEISY